jgi:hypothetical protein
MKRLYLEQGWTLAEVGRQFGMASWRVQRRFARAGVPVRRRGETLDPKFEAVVPDLIRLYVDERVSVPQLARKFGFPKHKIRARFAKIGVKPWGEKTVLKYPILATLKIGESFQVPKPTCKGVWHSLFYAKASKFKIRISIRVVDDDVVTITRTA